MLWNLILSCSVLLLSCSHLLAHPVADTAETAYSGPDSVDETGVFSPDEFSVADLSDLLQGAAAGHSPLLGRDGIKMSGQIPNEALKEVVIEKPYRLVPASTFWSSRKQFRKRGNGADCFWKYCV